VAEERVELDAAPRVIANRMDANGKKYSFP
jgi:hypothetical protein